MTRMDKVLTFGRYTHWTLTGDLTGSATTMLDTCIETGKPCLWIGSLEGSNTAPRREVIRLGSRIVEELTFWAKVWGCVQLRIEGTAKRLRQWARVLTGFVLIMVNGTPVLVKEIA